MKYAHKRGNEVLRVEQRTPNADLHTVLLFNLGEIGLGVREIVGIECEGAPFHGRHNKNHQIPAA